MAEANQNKPHVDINLAALRLEHAELRLKFLEIQGKIHEIDRKMKKPLRDISELIKADSQANHFSAGLEEQGLGEDLEW